MFNIEKALPYLKDPFASRIFILALFSTVFMTLSSCEVVRCMWPNSPDCITSEENDKEINLPSYSIYTPIEDNICDAVCGDAQFVKNNNPSKKLKVSIRHTRTNTDTKERLGDPKILYKKLDPGESRFLGCTVDRSASNGLGPGRCNIKNKFEGISSQTYSSLMGLPGLLDARIIRAQHGSSCISICLSDPASPKCFLMNAPADLASKEVLDSLSDQILQGRNIEFNSFETAFGASGNKCYRTDLLSKGGSLSNEGELCTVSTSISIFGEDVGVDLIIPEVVQADYTMLYSGLVVKFGSNSMEPLISVSDSGLNKDWGGRIKYLAYIDGFAYVETESGGCIVVE